MTLVQDDEPVALDYFVGGVPTGEYFRMTLEGIESISGADQDFVKGINRLQELCFIGLLSYFEAFCKDQFAAIINIEPNLISNLKAAGQDISVDASYVAMYANECDRRIGFLLASKYDFGTPQKINALFGALLRITPLGNKEVREYDQLLRDRNLLVHHGGIFTLRYLEQTVIPAKGLKDTAFWNSCTVSRKEVVVALGFIEGIARKLLRASHQGLLKFIDAHGLQYSPQRQQAMDFLLRWGDADA
jgi:hypothetical protein